MVIEKASEFISLTNHNDPQTQGTEVILNYDSFMKVFDYNSEKVKDFIEDNFLMGDISVKLLKIENGNSEQILCVSKPELDSKAVKLDMYLEGIEASIVLKNYNKEIKNLEDLIDGQSDAIFVFDSESNQLLDCNNVESSDYIEDDKISYLKVSVIDESIAEKFSKLIDALDDWDEAYEKIEKDISDEVYIFVKDIYSHNYTDGRMSIGDNLIDGYSFEEFCKEYNSNENCGTRVQLIDRIVSHKEGIYSVLPIKTDERIGSSYYSYQLSFYDDKKNKINQKIYNKNVYLSNMSLVVPYVAEFIKIDSAAINLKHKELIPNLARDSIVERLHSSELAYSIGRAIHLYFYENIDMNNEQKELLKVFIEKYYLGNNQFTRKDEKSVT